MTENDDARAFGARRECYVLNLQGAAGEDSIPLRADNDADALTSALRVVREALPDLSPDDEVQILRPDLSRVPGRYTVRTLAGARR